MKATTRDNLATSISVTRDLWRSGPGGDDIALDFARDLTSVALRRLAAADLDGQQPAIAACIVAANVWVEIARLAREQAGRHDRELVAA